MHSLTQASHLTTRHSGHPPKGRQSHSNKTVTPTLQGISTPESALVFPCLGNPLHQPTAICIRERQITYPPIRCNDLVSHTRVNDRKVCDPGQGDPINLLCTQYAAFGIYNEIPSHENRDLQQTINELDQKEGETIIRFCDHAGATVRYLDLPSPNQESQAFLRALESYIQTATHNFLKEQYITTLHFSLDLFNKKNTTEECIFNGHKGIDYPEPSSFQQLLHSSLTEKDKRKYQALLDVWRAALYLLANTQTFKALQRDILLFLQEKGTTWRGPVFDFKLVGPRPGIPAADQSKTIFHSDGTDYSHTLFQAFFASKSPTEVAPFVYNTQYFFTGPQGGGTDIDTGVSCIEQLRKTGNIIQAPANQWALYTGAPYHNAPSLSRTEPNRVLCSAECELNPEFLEHLTSKNKEAVPQLLKTLWQGYIFQKEAELTEMEWEE